MEQWAPTGGAGGVAHLPCRQYWGALPTKTFITRINPSKRWFCFDYHLHTPVFENNVSNDIRFLCKTKLCWFKFEKLVVIYVRF